MNFNSSSLPGWFSAATAARGSCSQIRTRQNGGRKLLVVGSGKSGETCNVSDISVQKKQAYLKFGNSPSTNQPVVPYQLWKPQFHLNSMWGKLNEIWSDLLWASSALCFPPDLRQRRIFDHSCGIWKVQLQNMRQPRWVTRFSFSFWIGGEGNQRKKSIISGDNLFLVLGLRGCLRVFQSCRFFFSFPF